MKHVSNLFESAMKNRSDYCLMILADSRYGSSDEKVEYLPSWLRNHIEQGNDNLSVD